MIEYAKKKDLTQIQEKASTLLEALPYLQRFAGKRVLIKVGGELLENREAAKSFARDVVLLKAVGLKIVICHGGGPQISRAMQELGKEPQFVRGLRVTDAETLRATLMVLVGEINQQLVALLNIFGSHAVGVSGASAKLLVARQKNPELGFVGEIAEVNGELLYKLFDAAHIPVVAPIGVDEQGALYNLNADTAAAALAAKLGCEKFMIVSNVEGLYEDFEKKESLISKLNSADLRSLASSGKLSAGMIPKSEAVLKALESGVTCAHLLDGRNKHALLLEIFTAEGVGTMIER